MSHVVLLPTWPLCSVCCGQMREELRSASWWLYRVFSQAFSPHQPTKKKIEINFDFVAMRLFGDDNSQVSACVAAKGVLLILMLLTQPSNSRTRPYEIFQLLFFFFNILTIAQNAVNQNRKLSASFFIVNSFFVAVRRVTAVCRIIKSDSSEPVLVCHMCVFCCVYDCRPN